MIIWQHTDMSILDKYEYLLRCDIQDMRKNCLIKPTAVQVDLGYVGRKVRSETKGDLRVHVYVQDFGYPISFALSNDWWPLLLRKKSFNII